MNNIIYRLAVLLSLAGCTEDLPILKTEGSAGIIKTEITRLELEQKENSFSIHVFANDNVSWLAEYSSDSDWLHISNEGEIHNGTGEITGTVSENQNPKERSATIEIHTTGEFGTNMSAINITVVQFGTDPFIKIMDLNNNILDEYNIGYNKSLVTIRISSNVDWIINSDADWITIQSPDGMAGNGSGNIEFEVSENGSYETSRTGYISVSMVDNLEIAAMLKIEQDKKSDNKKIIIDNMSSYLPGGEAILTMESEGVFEVPVSVADYGNMTAITIVDDLNPGKYFMKEIKYGNDVFTLGGYVVISEEIESYSEYWDAVLKQFGGTTPERALIIDSADDLYAISQAVNSGNSYTGIYLSQICDISLAAYSNWLPIGNPNFPFSGIYNGNGHMISDLNISTANSNAGLFGSISGNQEFTAIIDGIELYGNIIATGSGAGCIAGYVMNHSIIRNCINNASWDFSGGYSGGIAGICTSDATMTSNQNRLDNILIERCLNRSSGRFSQKSDNGGIVGFNYGVVKDCVFEGEIISNVMRIGGIVGGNNGIVEKCSSSGKMTMENLNSAHNSGGIVGFSSQYSIIRNCLFEGDMSGITDYRSGGLVGMFSNQNSGQASIEIKNCLVVGKLNERTGVIAGNNNGYSLENMKLNGKISGIYFDETLSEYKNFGSLNTSIGEIEGISKCLSTQEMTEEESFENWDFNEIWQINEEKGYPTIKQYNHEN